MSLSDRIQGADFWENGGQYETDGLLLEDVKEFINELKSSPDFDDEDRNFINKLAGERFA